MEEVWKDVVGYEGMYQVSNLGRIRSLDRFVNSSVINIGKKKTKGRILKQCICHGYLVVSLGKNGKTQRVHRLVANEFIPNPENKPHIDHINTIRTDNRVENLRWVTAKENSNNPISKEKIRKVMTGRKQSEESNNKRKEKAKKQKVICVETNTIYESMKECGRKNGITSSQISRACRGIRKTAGGLHWKFI